MMRACSSIRLPSPMMMGPASAIIRAFGWTTVLGPETRRRVRSQVSELEFKVTIIGLNVTAFSSSGCLLTFFLSLIHIPI